MAMACRVSFGRFGLLLFPDPCHTSKRGHGLCAGARRQDGPGRRSDSRGRNLARKGNIGVYYSGLGAVTPIYTVLVKSQIAGYLMQVLYKEGHTVTKGDPLAEIDPRPYQVMLEQAQAGLARDQANLENAKVDLKRYQTLAPLKAIPEQQLATQAATVKQDQAVIQNDQAQIDTAKLDLYLLPHYGANFRARGAAARRSWELRCGQ